jgi:hypothetical protein
LAEVTFRCHFKFDTRWQEAPHFALPFCGQSLPLASVQLDMKI